jgi:[CysO sulfur-carrier protein]-S-L-cysteine hydrolase
MPNMYLQIPYHIARQIADHAQNDYPNEVCGLLAGTESKISSAIPINNIADTPQNHYQLDPSEQITALKRIDADNLQWQGIYHSHPKSHPIPSPTDITDSNDSSLIHIIVSLKDSQPKLKAWQILETSVIPIELIFDTQSPSNDAHEPLSNHQKTAIILTSIICVILMLVISFTLLPAAPEITSIP